MRQVVETRRWKRPDGDLHLFFPPFHSFATTTTSWVHALHSLTSLHFILCKKRWRSIEDDDNFFSLYNLSSSLFKGVVVTADAVVTSVLIGIMQRGNQSERDSREVSFNSFLGGERERDEGGRWGRQMYQKVRQEGMRCISLSPVTQLNANLLRSSLLNVLERTSVKICLEE